MRNTSASANTHEDLNSMLIAAVTNPLGEVVDTQTVAELLARGANVNAARPDGATALMLAAKRGHTEIVSALLACDGINVNAVTSSGVSALMLAAQNGRAEIVSALLARDSDFNAQTSNGATALMFAAERGHTEIVSTLLAYEEIDVNAARTSNGSTALMFAAQNGHEGIVSALLARDGINVNAVRSNGATALMLAAQNGHTRSVLALLERGADVNAVRRDGTTALMFAALKGHTEIVSALLARSDINLKILDDQLNHPGLRNLNKEVSELLAGALTDGEKRNSFIERFNQRNPNDRIQIIQPLQQAPNSLAESQSQTSPAVTISNPNLIAKVTPKQNEGRCTVS